MTTPTDPTDDFADFQDYVDALDDEQTEWLTGEGEDEQSDENGGEE